MAIKKNSASRKSALLKSSKTSLAKQSSTQPSQSLTKRDQLEVAIPSTRAQSSRSIRRPSDLNDDEEAEEISPRIDTNHNHSDLDNELDSHDDDSDELPSSDELTTSLITTSSPSARPLTKPKVIKVTQSIPLMSSSSVNRTSALALFPKARRGQNGFKPHNTTNVPIPFTSLRIRPFGYSARSTRRRESVVQEVEYMVANRILAYQLMGKNGLHAWSDQTDSIESHILEEWRRCRKVMVEYWVKIGKEVEKLPVESLHDRSPFLRGCLQKIGRNRNRITTAIQIVASDSSYGWKSDDLANVGHNALVAQSLLHDGAFLRKDPSKSDSAPFLNDRLVTCIHAAFFGRGSELSLATAYHTQDIITRCNGALVSWVCAVLHEKITQKGVGGSGSLELAKGMSLQRQYRVSWDAQSDQRRTMLSNLLFEWALNRSKADRNEIETVEDVQPILNVHANDISDLQDLESELFPNSSSYLRSDSGPTQHTSSIPHASSPLSSMPLSSSPPSSSTSRRKRISKDNSELKRSKRSKYQTGEEEDPMPQTVLIVYANGSASISMDIEDVAIWADLLRCSNNISESPLFYASWAGQVAQSGNDHPVSDEDEYEQALQLTGKAGATELRLEISAEPCD